MKSYGRWDSSWDEKRIRDMLEDASDMAKTQKTSFHICEDENGEIVMTSNKRDPQLILVCGIEYPRFWDNVDFAHYTIDEMVPRAYNLLVKGIIEYGRIGFLSEGRLQLMEALQDAERLSRKYGKPFIIGKGKHHDIMVAPMSEKSKFLASCSCVVTKSGSWSISDMHSHRIMDPIDMLYMAIAYGTKNYGIVRDDKSACMLNLERAFEDAVRTSPHAKNKCRVGITKHDEITVKFGRDAPPNMLEDKSLEINPEEFLDGNVLLREKITAAAKDAYERFSRARHERKTPQNRGPSGMERFLQDADRKQT